MKESKFYQEIMEEGGVLVRRAYLIEALQLRFGREVGDEFAPAINAITRNVRIQPSMASPP